MVQEGQQMNGCGPISEIKTRDLNQCGMGALKVMVAQIKRRVKNKLKKPCLVFWGWAVDDQV